MQRIFCLLIALAVPLVFGAAAGDDDVQRELKALQGTWKTVGGEATGEPFAKDAIPDFTFIVAADGVCTGKYAGSEWQFTMKIDPRKAPKTIENLHATGPQKGMKQYGIYELKGDKFTTCMTPPGSVEADRPKTMATKETKNVLFVFERVKPTKKS